MIATPHGEVWPEDRLRTGTPVSLGDGVAGVTLFFRELYVVMRERAHEREMRRGADCLATTWRREAERSGFPPNTSLYYGLPGIAFVLSEVAATTAEARYRREVASVVAAIHDAFGRGDSAATDYNDVLFGKAGAGLFLLYAAQAMGSTESLELARHLGYRLIATGQNEQTGYSWVLRDGTKLVLPNFSHGAAGVGYFLARLFEISADSVFLQRAEGAAAYLESIADRTAGGFLVPYGFGRAEWRTQYDLGWAHGPAGSARLFWQLASVSRSRNWMGLVDSAAVGIKSRGVPLTPSGSNLRSWDLSRRFGLAGVADFFVTPYERTGRQQDLIAACSMADQILSQSRRTAGRIWWVTRRWEFMQFAWFSPGSCCRGY